MFKKKNLQIISAVSGQSPILKDVGVLVILPAEKLFTEKTNVIVKLIHPSVRSESYNSISSFKLLL